MDGQSNRSNIHQEKQYTDKGKFCKKMNFYIALMLITASIVFPPLYKIQALIQQKLS